MAGDYYRHFPFLLQKGHYFMWQLASTVHRDRCRVTAGGAKLAAIPFCRESFSAPFDSMWCHFYYGFLLLLPLALQPTVGFGLSNSVLPLFPICHQLSPSTHSQHSKNSLAWFVYSLLSWSSPFTCLAWEALPVAYATASIALRIMWPHKSHHYVKVGIPSDY